MSEPKQKPYYRIANGVAHAAAHVIAAYNPKMSRRLVVNMGVELLLAGISLIRMHGVPHELIRAIVEYTGTIDPCTDAVDPQGIIDVQGDSVLLRLARLIVNAEEVPEVPPPGVQAAQANEAKPVTKGQVFFQSPGSTAKN